MIISPDECKVERVSSEIVVHNLIPTKAGLIWKLSLYDLSAEIPSHYHNVQIQLMIVLEGSVGLQIGMAQSVLTTGEFITLPPRTTHCIYANENARFLVLDIPGSEYPEDTYTEELAAEIMATPLMGDTLKTGAVLEIKAELDSTLIEQLRLPRVVPQQYYISKFQYEGYAVFALCENAKKWGVVIIDLDEAVEHYHKKESEHFIVLNGRLQIMLDGEIHYLNIGQRAHVPPYVKHKLKSDLATPVRLLCINLPSFDPEDFYLV